MQESLKTLITILKSAVKGQNIQIENADIAFVFAGEPLYFVMPDDEDVVWIRVSKDVLVDFLSEEISNSFLNKIKERENSMIVCETFFWKNLLINGIVEIGDSPIEPQKKAHIIVATKIKESLKTTWKRGSITLVGDQSYTEINQKLKERISGALQPYVGSNIFLFLNNEIMQQFKNQGKSNNKYLITECQQCGKLEIYHAFEIANKCCTPMLCRNCGKSKYKNLCEVPFSDTFLIDIFGEFTDFFDLMQKSQEPPKELIEKLLKYAKLDHHLEVGVVYEDLRNQYKKKFQYDNYILMNKIDEVIEQAKCNKPFFEDFLKLDDKFSTLQSFQTTTDITDTFGKIDNDIKNKYLDFYFPRPIHSMADDSFIDIRNINEEWFTTVINLYKDVFDLTGDHWFISNLAKVLKKAPVLEDCITPDLYGDNLVKKTLRYTKGTVLYDIVNDVYNVKVRNAIAHPGRVIDPIKKVISIYDKGELTDTFSIEEFDNIVKKLINFHLELTYAKYRLSMRIDQEYLKTGGILSFQPDFFTKDGENEKPHLIINQLYNFKKYSPTRFWWKDQIKIKKEKQENILGLKIFVQREKSKFFESNEIRESIYTISPYIKEWLEMVLEQGEYVVTHRFCHIPTDIDAKDEDLPWIPISIPIMPLEQETEVYITSMSECGIVKITMEEKSDIELILK